jgi:hypothetical protein
MATQFSPRYVVASEKERLVSKLLDKFEIANYFQVNKVVIDVEEAKKENVKRPLKVYILNRFLHSPISTSGGFYLTNSVITLPIMQEHIEGSYSNIESTPY